MNDDPTAGFDALDKNIQDLFNGTYGADVGRYFWAMQNQSLPVPEGGQGFLNMPLDQQKLWFRTHGAEAPSRWAYENGQRGSGGQGGSQAKPGTPYGQTPVGQRAYPTAVQVPGSGRDAGGNPTFATTKAPYAGQQTGAHIGSGMPTAMAVPPGTTFPGGGVDPGGNRYFQGRDDEGGPLGWGPERTGYSVNPATGARVASSTQLGRPDSGWDASANGGKGAARQPGAYYGAQPHSFAIGHEASSMEGGGPIPRPGIPEARGINQSMLSGGQGDPSNDQWNAGTNAALTDQEKQAGRNWSSYTNVGGGDYDYQGARYGYNAWIPPQIPGTPGTSGGGAAIRPDPWQVSVYQRNQGQGGGGPSLMSPGYGGGAPEQGYGGGYDTAKRAFYWEGNMEGDYAVIGNLLGRSDTDTGISTGWNQASPQAWQVVAAAIKNGQVKVSPVGWQFLAQKGITPQSLGVTIAQTRAPAGYGTAGGNYPDGTNPATGGAGGAPGAPGAAGTTPDQQWGGTLPEGSQTPFGPITGGLPGGFGVEWQALILQKTKEEFDRKVEEAKQTGMFNGVPTLDREKAIHDWANQEAQTKIQRDLADSTIRAQLFDEAYKNTQLKQNQQKIDADIKNMDEQIAVKREEIASIAATGDKDREQRERENLRLMENQRNQLQFQKDQAVGFIGGQATLDMQKFMAEQQQLAYTRAANPASSFENEMARAATGWNAPGVDPNAQGIPGVTMPGQTMQQYMAAGGFQQPTMYPSQYGQPMPGVPGQPGVASVPTAQGTAAGQPGGAYNVSAQQGTQPAVGGPPSGPGQNQAGQGAQVMAGAAAQGAAEAAQQPSLAANLLRTPAAVNAFKGGWASPGTGSYGVGNTMETAQNAFISPDQVRLQNLKQSRRMNPNARAIVSSFAGAGEGSSQAAKDQFSFYSDKGAPKTAASSASYSLK